MAELDDAKTSLAKKMAQGSQGGVGGSLGGQGPQPGGMGLNGASDPVGVQDAQYRGDFSAASRAHMNDVNLRDWGYTGDANNIDQNKYNDAYNNWLYNSNDVLANAMTTESQKQQYQLDKEAKSYGDNLDQMKSNSNNLLSAQADQTLGQGLHNVRKDANSRGLLYSNIREGGEANLKGRVSSMLAHQIADSNAEFDQGLQSRKMSAAQAKIGEASAALERQAQVDSVRQQNQIARGQQMQQLASIAGYAAGRYMNQDSSVNPNAENRQTTGGGHYMSSGSY